jgi:hypothetical protein
MEYGLNWERELDEQEDTDYRFGGSSPVCIALIPQSEREKYLPVGEVQKGKQDWMDCATRGPINKLEAKFTYLYQSAYLSQAQREFLTQYEQDGRITFSDRFIAIKSGTDRNGNSLKAPCDAIHRCGLIPKTMLPADKSMTFDQYHDASKITREMERKGLEFLEHFAITYERVYPEDFPNLIDEDMIVVAGYAWPKAVNGEYPKTTKSPNHAFLYFRIPRFTIFDNYEEGRGDFVKKLASDYDLMSYGYRLSIADADITEKKISIIQRLISLLWQQLATLGSWIGFAR